MRSLRWLIPLLLAPAGCGPASGGPSIKTVFLIVMENRDWSAVAGSPSAPYINQTLLKTGAHAERYFNPPGLHPSLPNYLWLEGGQDFGVHDDQPPSVNHRASPAHLATQLRGAGIEWRAYEEDMIAGTCPLTANQGYAPRHNPFVFFDDSTGANDPKDPYCSAHNRPLTQLAADLVAPSVARYNFITPNLCHDMHDTCPPEQDQLRQGDDWLASWVPLILASPAYRQGGAIFIVWDESEALDVPIGLIVLSTAGRGNGYSSSIAYTHGSTLRTLQEIFGVGPPLGDAARQPDLADLFRSFP